MADLNGKEKENKDSNQDFFNVSFDRPVSGQDVNTKYESSSPNKSSSKWNDFYERFKEEELLKYGNDYDGAFNNKEAIPTQNDLEAGLNSKTLKLDKMDLINPEKNSSNIFSQSFNKVQDILKDIGGNSPPDSQHLKNRSIQDIQLRERPSFIQIQKEKSHNNGFLSKRRAVKKESKLPESSEESSMEDTMTRSSNSKSLQSKTSQMAKLTKLTSKNTMRKNDHSVNKNISNVSENYSDSKIPSTNQNHFTLKENDFEQLRESNKSSFPKRSEIHSKHSKNKNIKQESQEQHSSGKNKSIIAAGTLTSAKETLSSKASTNSSLDDGDFKELSFPSTHSKINQENTENSRQDFNKRTEKSQRSDGSHKKHGKQDKKEAYSISEFSAPKKASFTFSVILNVVKKLALILIILGILGAALAGGMGIGYFANLVGDTVPPSKEKMAAQIYQLDQQSTLYYASGEPIANVRTDVVRSVTSLDNVSDYIIDGFIATEDEYFAEHPGIVPKAILRAVLETFITGSGTGGSTLTQQLVKQQLLTNEVTFFRKANEILLALRLENYFSKEEILTAYLNVSPFGRNNSGDNVAGIGKASEGIFGVKPDQVNLNQAAFLAGLPQDPYRYTPYDQYGQLRENLEPGIQRMQEVLFRMYRDQRISKDEYEQAMNYDISKDFLEPQKRTQERQSYLYQAVMFGAIQELMLLNIEDDGYTWQQVFEDVDWYNEYYFAAEDQLRTGGYKVYTTIDKEIYNQLQESARAYEDEIGVTYDGVYTDPSTGHETYYIEKVQTGLVAIDNPTGKVLGFVSGTDFENNQIDHAFNMRRSPGSTIKPMAVYGPAIEHNIINPATVIPDTAFVEVYDDGSTWEPTNYGNAVSGDLITVRRALLRSDNLPAVRIYDELLKQGIPIIDYLAMMGFNTVDSYTEADTQNLAFSLGGVTTGPTVFEETRGFTTFANNGYYIDGYYIERIEDAFGNVVFQHNEAPVKVFSEDTNYLMVDMLRDTLTEGTGRTAANNMVVPGDWIAKTGISENSKDIWVIASTPKITIGSWIGYDSKYYDYTIDVNDGFGLESVRSQIYWARIINDLYAIRPEIFGTDLTFDHPDSVVEQTILQETGTLPGTTTFNGQTYSLTQPLTTELFKVVNPAPPLTGDFLFGASPEEQARFWQQRLSREQELIIEQQRIQEQEEDEETTDEESSQNPEEASDTPSANDASEADLTDYQE